MTRVWRYFFQARGAYSTVAGRIEYQLFRRSRRYRRFYDAAVGRA